MVQATDDKFSRTKVHWWSYNHCLFVLYLASVAFGYRWISDTKFQKFLDKDWIWTFNNVSNMDQELKNQYLLTSGILFKFSAETTRDRPIWLFGG